MVSQILAIRRNITNVRKILQAHQHVLKRLIRLVAEHPRYALQPNDRTFGELMEVVREGWDNLDNLKERIEALQQTNESQIAFRTSDIMKTLTIISVFTFPLTLVAAVFSVVLTNGMPWLNRPGNFWYMVGVQLAVAAVMFLSFKRKRWF
jgi:Mg2+ and Co2+ transporter CorA